MDNKKEYSGGLIRNEAWRKRRQKIIARAGRSSGVQSPLNEIQPVCKSARYVPCKQKKKPGGFLLK